MPSCAMCGGRVEHVARLQHPFLGRLEMLEHLQRQILAQRQVLLRADAPAALAMHLQQEYIVRIEVRADAAAIGRVRDHQVVQARVGDEAKALEQGARGIVVQVHALHQQGPFALAHRRQRAVLEGPLFQLPSVTKMRDQTRFRIVVGGQFEQRVARQRRHDIGDRLADQQRLFLPVAAHELRRRQLAEQRGGRVGVGGAGFVLDRGSRAVCRFGFGPLGHRIMRLEIGRFG